MTGRESEAIHMRWTRWGQRTTTGHGHYVSATGTSGSQTLKASHIVTCDGRRVYSQLTYPITVEATGKTVWLKFPFNRSSCLFVWGGTTS